MREGDCRKHKLLPPAPASTDAKEAEEYVPASPVPLIRLEISYAFEHLPNPENLHPLPAGNGEGIGMEVEDDLMQDLDISNYNYHLPERRGLSDVG